MRVLVAYATRHGSTKGVAEAIAEELRGRQLEVDLRDIHDAGRAHGYDAAVIGSPVYVGSWLKEARAFVDREQTDLASTPVWLFSVGPLGAEHPQPEGDPKDVAALTEAVHPRQHRIFAGALDRRQLSLLERFTVRMVSAPYGDFRDWDAIRGWAREIGATLQSESAAA